MKNKELFEIQGWGFLQISAGGTYSCGTAKGAGFNMKDEAGGVMDYKEILRLRNFLNKVLLKSGGKNDCQKNNRPRTAGNR